jgi:hypothetical protein
MHSQIGIFLQATPDFNSFLFAIGAKNELRVGLSFAHSKDDVFDLIIERRYEFESSEPVSFTTEDIDMFLHSITYVLELYTGKYTDRIVRCEAADQIQESVFRIIFRHNKDLMGTLFSIQQEENKKQPRPSSKRKAEGGAFLLKRIQNKDAAPFLAEQMITTYSQIFRNPLLVRLYEASSQSNTN